MNEYIPRLANIFFILDWDQSDKLAAILSRCNCRFYFAVKGRGTASSEVLDMLGLGSTEKAVFICLEQDQMTPVILREVSRELGFYRPGAGIAFSIPMAAVNTALLSVFKESVKKDMEKLEGENEMEENNKHFQHELIVAVVNQGFSDELMSAARTAGARGGTVLNARGLMHQGPVKFFGISVQEEREIIMIISDRDHKVPIMQAIGKDFGVTSQAGGIIYSLPVDHTMGLK
jgi:hypothetical protein